MKRNEHFDHLQFIPYEYEDEENYEIIKEAFYDCLEDDKRNFSYLSVRNCVNRWLNECDVWMDENGMRKATYIIASMLFQMKYKEVDEQLAYEAHCDVADLETGKYDYLFHEDDLPQLKEDMKLIREYLNKHPHLCEL